MRCLFSGDGCPVLYQTVCRCRTVVRQNSALSLSKFQTVSNVSNVWTDCKPEGTSRHLHTTPTRVGAAAALSEPHGSKAELGQPDDGWGGGGHMKAASMVQGLLTDAQTYAKQHPDHDGPSDPAVGVGIS